MSASAWAALAATGQNSLVAVPPAPTGAVLTTPPANEQQAQQTVDSLVNQQMANQQAVDASQVDTSWTDTLSSAAVSAATPSWTWVFLLGGAALFAGLFLGGKR